MPKLTWTIINNTQSNLDITQYVRSLSFTLGRASALSTYSGNTATVTITNTADQVQYAEINDTIRLKATATGGTDFFSFIGVVASRNFQDQPGNANNSTATILINDSLLQAGMANFVAQSLSSTNNQIAEIDNALPQISINDLYGTNAAMSVGTFTVNVGQRLNEIFTGDRGVIANGEGDTNYYPTSEFDNLINANSPTFGRTTSATQIAYQSFDRVEAASNSLFYTQATVTGSASTETKSSAALTTYGTRTFTASTAQSNLVSETAEWYANAFSDPYTECINISFTDISQNAAALNLFNWQILSRTKFAQLSYTPPGGVSTTGYYWPEQIIVNATTSQTTIDMVMTPLTYYANFILNDAVFGVLDTDRLGV